jgi:hypothetical protein
MSVTGTRSYTGTATGTPTMTILNAGVAQQVSNSNSDSPNIAIVGIAAGASVIGILGLAFAIAFSRRSPRQKLVSPVYHDEPVEVRHNPSHAPMERQRSMTYPVDPDPPKNVMPSGLKNPFAAKSTNMNFVPTQIRKNYDLPPPPPPLEEV